MIAVDTNILIFSHKTESPFHRKAKESIDLLRHQSATWALPWPCIHEFLGIVTHPKIYRTPTTLPDAFAAINAWLAGGNVQLLAESEGYLDTLHQATLSAKVQGPRIHEARIAALCLHHGVTELWTADRDFAKFPRLKTRNPLR